jgi:hypothetical protein
MKSKKIDLVIARYNESLDWLKDYADKKFNKIYVYNKGKTSVECPLKPLEGEVIYEQLPNVGRCDHTYIHHIIKNYNSLGDVTLFIKGSVVCPTRGLPREPEKFKLTLNKLFETNNSVFVGKKYLPDIGTSMKDSNLHTYVAGCKINVNVTTKIPLHPANPRMFGDWYKERFPNVKDETRVCFAGIFAVSREHIQHNKHTSEYYEPFLKELAEHSNPTAGHFIERSWLALFYRIPDECFYENLSPWQGGRRRSTRRKVRRVRKKYAKTY